VEIEINKVITVNIEIVINFALVVYIMFLIKMMQKQNLQIIRQLMTGQFSLRKCHSQQLPAMAVAGTSGSGSLS